MARAADYTVVGDGGPSSVRSVGTYKGHNLNTTKVCLGSELKKSAESKHEGNPCNMIGPSLSSLNNKNNNFLIFSLKTTTATAFEFGFKL